MKYLKNKEIKEYFKILCQGDYPSFIDDYINTKEMQRLSGIGLFCGVDYQKLDLHDVKYWYSRLHHSIACALMAWNFTKDKIQTLAALFHDLGTPVFSHAIDYMLGDSINHNSSEIDIKSVINDSADIINLLQRDNININDVSDIDKYTIVENKRPKICVDRLESLFSGAIIWGKFWGFSDAKDIYGSISININENNENEIAFTDIQLVEKLYEGANTLHLLTKRKEDKLSMQLLGDIVKCAVDNKIVTTDELYTSLESDIISKFESSNSEELLEMWNAFRNLTTVYSSDKIVKDRYCISINTKDFYINPLCSIDGKIKRLLDISDKAAKLYKEAKVCKEDKYVYIDYNFKYKNKITV